MGKKVTVSAELMDDYKRMSIAMPEKKMRVCSGERTMYSIGNDGNLYLLLENRKEHKGWEKITHNNSKGSAISGRSNFE